MPGGGELRLHGGKLVAQLAGLVELLLQGRDQRIRLSQREEPYLRESLHARHGTRGDGQIKPDHALRRRDDSRDVVRRIEAQGLPPPRARTSW